MTKRPATLKDVAAAAGVSYQTVSRVINHDPRVRPATREAVTSAIAALAFEPNSAARALVSGRTRTIGVLVEDLLQHGPRHTLDGLEEAAAAAGWDLAIVSLRRAAARDVPRAAASIAQRRARALVLINATEEVTEALMRLDPRIPLLGTSQATRHILPFSVQFDQRAGVGLAIDHLVDSGRRHVAHLAGPPQSLDARLRRTETVVRLRRRGLVVASVQDGDWSARSGRAAMRRILLDGPVDAVFCANDQMALGAMTALQEEGVAVPNDVAVVGFDDLPEAAFFHPALTTIAQDFGRLGTQLFGAVMSALQDSPSPLPPDVAPLLVQRASS